VKDQNSDSAEEHHSDQEHLGHDPELLVEVIGTKLDQPYLQHKRNAQTCRSKMLVTRALFKFHLR
jgi:hypothetical protein